MGKFILVENTIIKIDEILSVHFDGKNTVINLVHAGSIVLPESAGDKVEKIWALVTMFSDQPRF